MEHKQINKSTVALIREKLYRRNQN